MCSLGVSILAFFSCTLASCECVLTTSKDISITAQSLVSWLTKWTLKHSEFLFVASPLSGSVKMDGNDNVIHADLRGFCLFVYNIACELLFETIPRPHGGGVARCKAHGQTHGGSVLHSIRREQRKMAFPGLFTGNVYQYLEKTLENMAGSEVRSHCSCWSMARTCTEVAACTERGCWWSSVCPGNQSLLLRHAQACFSLITSPANSDVVSMNMVYTLFFPGKEWQCESWMGLSTMETCVYLHLGNVYISTLNFPLSLVVFCYEKAWRSVRSEKLKSKTACVSCMFVVVYPLSWESWRNGFRGSCGSCMFISACQTESSGQ